jgi:hypothetical protein
MVGSFLMRPFRTVTAALAALLIAAPAPAWNFGTHRVIAAIAYDKLKPAARARVDALLKLHPDYTTKFLQSAPADQAARAAFIEAAVWADDIRNDPRFYDDTRLDSKPTPFLAGFPDMKRHTPWHFIDVPFSQDGTPLEPAPVPNIVTALERIGAELRSHSTSQSVRAYDLVWLLHLTGDIHQPLHNVARFSSAAPKGDQGGNLVFVDSGGSAVNLHAYWDGALGADSSPAWVEKTARELMSAPSNPKISLGFDPKTWSNEGLILAEKEVYTFGASNGSRGNPVTLPPGYAANANRLAQIQAAKAGLRLAAAINLLIK